MKYHGFAVEVGLRPSDPFFRVLYNMEIMLTNIFVVTSVTVVIASVVGGLIFSHRVAGPMYRLRKHCEAVGRGETLGNVNFRKGDYFSDVADAYNLQIHHLRQRLGVDPLVNAPQAEVQSVDGIVTEADPVNVEASGEKVAETRAETETADDLKKAS